MRRLMWILAGALVWGCGGGDDDPQVIAPPDAEVDAEGQRGAATIGAPCAEDADCADGLCLGEGSPDAFPGGACAAPCDACPDGTACAGEGDDAFCAPTCGECREGYTCQRTVGANVCLPTIEGPAPDGAACAVDEDCLGGTCLLPPQWPRGYCTSDCATSADCNGGVRNGRAARCLDNPREDDFCVQGCANAEDCRRGYLCQDVNGVGICVGDPDPEELSPEEIAAHPLGIQCEAAGAGEIRVRYEIAADTHSYMFVPFTPDGRSLTPRYIDLPTGELDFSAPENEFQAFNAWLHGFMNATVVPGHAGLSRQKVAGNHRFALTTDSDQICHYLLEKQGPGAVLDLNVYLVGLPDVDAASAAESVPLRKVFERVEQVFTAAGVRLGTVRYLDPPRGITEVYSVVRSDAAAAALIASLPRPGDTLDAVLSLNVAMVQTFAVPQQHELLGQSQGLPGPAGLHGTTASGVVISAEYLGEAYRTERGFLIGNQFIGDTLAHEVGHYLGLLHTTEVSQTRFDPLEDTPPCEPGMVMPEGCPDWQNLMFPLADTRERVVSDGQSWMLTANPLIKEAP